MSTSPSPERSPVLTGQLIVWSVSLVVALAAAIFAPEGTRFSLLAVGLAVCLIAGFARELWLQKADGFLLRVALLSSGSFVIFTLVAGFAGFVEALAY